MFSKLFAVLFLLMAVPSHATYVGPMQEFTCDAAVKRLIPPNVEIKVLKARSTAGSHFARFMDPNTGAAFDPTGTGSSTAFCFLGVRQDNSLGYNQNLFSVPNNIATATWGDTYSTASTPSSIQLEFQDVDTPIGTAQPPSNINAAGQTVAPIARCSKFTVSGDAIAGVYTNTDSPNTTGYGYDAVSGACPY